MSLTNWMHDSECPCCGGMTLATNGTGSRWCIDRKCGYAIHITRRRIADETDPDRLREDRDDHTTPTGAGRAGG